MANQAASDLLVIGAGPYALSTAALARARGIDTAVVGTPMAFWREHMPERMFLRSGPDWHLDAAGEHTLEAYIDERGIDRAGIDPIPIALFLDYCGWFQQMKRLNVNQDRVVSLETADGGYRATLAGGGAIAARAVVAAPGVRDYAQLPDWAEQIPPGRATHTCELVRFDRLAGQRVLIVGGRQSAYEWAALLHEHGAERVDVVHRHPLPRFERVSWAFVDAHVEQTIAVPGYWRRLPQSQREAVARRFWEVGRLTLEYWLVPRLEWAGLRRWPDAELAELAETPSGLAVRLSNGERLEVDHIVFATGYRPQLERVPYLAGLAPRIVQRDGFPELDEGFQTSLPRLYLTGFSATNDFGPFFGFVKGCPAAATLVVRDLLA